MSDQGSERGRDELRQLRPFNPNEHLIQNQIESVS